MKAKRLRGEHTWALVFDKGDEVISLLTEFAEAHLLSASHFTAIGAFDHVLLGFFEWEKKQYRKTLIEEQVEVVSLSGFITDSPEGRKVHAHVVLGRPDSTALGGHLLEGRVRPTLELLLTVAPQHLTRREDPETGLPLIDLPPTST